MTIETKNPKGKIAIEIAEMFNKKFDKLTGEIKLNHAYGTKTEIGLFRTIVKIIDTASQVEYIQELVILDNSQRVFQVTGHVNGDIKSVFCNLTHIPAVIKHFNTVKCVYHFWDGERKNARKEYVNSMLKGANIMYRWE